MPAKVTFSVTKGGLAGKKFIYGEKEALILGRQEECAIVLTENTVSRYHCMIEVNPPEVTVRDFGSLNGTFLNGKKIGQREKDVSAEEAREETHIEFPLKAGDTLGLGRDCELTLSVYTPTYCSDCLCEIAEEDAGRYQDEDGLMLCRACHEKREQELKAEQRAAKEAREAEEKRKEAERRAAELAAKEKEAKDRAARERAERERVEAERKAAELRAQEEKKAREQREEAERRREREAVEAARRAQAAHATCAICGASFTPVAAGDQICPECLLHPMKVLKFLMREAMGGAQPKAKAGGGGGAIKGYRQVRLLGRGGMGEVWLVEEEKTKKQMALKLMLPKVAADERARAMFAREALVADHLNHKNVVRQYRSGESSGVFYILLELCQGGSVDELIKKKGGKLPVDIATEIILQVLDGLEYAHHAKVECVLADGSVKKVHGLVHRDFKPGNIFLSDTSAHPVAKVADFGLAKSFETAGLTGMTRTGNAAGTPMFMPRQQIMNFKYAQPDVDVWAAAASYYFMLTGQFPKEARGRDIWAAMLTEKAVPVRTRNPSVPKQLAEVIDTALIDRPAIQITSAAQLKKMILGAI